MNWAPLYPRHWATGCQDTGNSKTMLFPFPSPSPAPRFTVKWDKQMQKLVTLIQVGFWPMGSNTQGWFWSQSAWVWTPAASLMTCIFLAFLHLVFLCKIGIDETFIMWAIGRIKWGDLCSIRVCCIVNPQHVRFTIFIQFNHGENTNALWWRE